MAQPEKISLWDRLFNRYRWEVIKRGDSRFIRTWEGIRIPNSEYIRHWVEYKIIDRVTGSERIKRDYLDNEWD